MKKRLRSPFFRIGKRIINQDSFPYIIAEIGVNYEGSLSRAKRLNLQAKKAGAGAVKFQSYKAGLLAVKNNSPAYWDIKKEPCKNQYELFKKYDSFGRKEFVTLAGYCQKLGIDFLCTPFDDESIKFLKPLVPCFKIASADITNIPFLRRIAHTGKPVILSTGASTLPEINLALRELKNGGCNQIVLLHCILNYPTAYRHANLNMIESLKKNFPERIIGYSDHCSPDKNMLLLTSAYLRGAWIIEKHFTDHKKQKGNDHYHAMNMGDLKLLISQIKFARETGGTSIKKPILSEKVAIKNARRSIVTQRAIPKGHVLNEKDITCKRPGTGISPIYWDTVVGKRTKRNLAEDSILQWADLH